MEVSDQIIKVLDDLSKRVGVAIDWSSNNVMPYLKELYDRFILYEVLTSILWLIVGIGICFLGLYLLKRINKNKDFGVDKNFHYHDSTGRVFGYIGIIVIILIGIIIGISQIMDIITCIVIPEKIILNELLPYITK